MQRQAWFFEALAGTNYPSTLSALSLTRGDPTRERFRNGVARKIFWSETGLCRLTLAVTESRLGVELEWKEGPSPLQDRQLQGLFGLLDATELNLCEGDPLMKIPLRVRQLRLARVFWLQEAAIQTVLHQRVSGAEAGKNWGALCRRFGHNWDGLWSAPSPRRLLSMSAAEYAGCGIENHRRIPIQEAVFRLPLLTSPDHCLDDLESRMLGCRRLGRWTSAYVRGHFLGDSDAVPLGDYNLPHLVGYFFRGVRRSTDHEMLDDLNPYAGHRFRVLRWLGAAGITLPRRGPRLALGNSLG